MKTLTKEQIELLNKPLPKEAIKKHPSKSFLNTINAIFVTERLNEVFGVGAWKTSVEFVAQQGKMVVTKTTLTIEDYGIRYECYGGNDNADLGDAYKGSVTDAITKIGSWMGIGAHVWKNDPYPQEPTGEDLLLQYIANCTSMEDFADLGNMYGEAIKASPKAKAAAIAKQKELKGGEA